MPSESLPRKGARAEAPPGSGEEAEVDPLKSQQAGGEREWLEAAEAAVV
jgi:hypothetical protein